MEKSIQGYLGSLQLGEIQQFKNLTIGAGSLGLR
jgi:hypothetical protein